MGKAKVTGVIVGAGFIGKEHLDCSLRNKDIAIIGIVDPSSENGKKIAEKAHCAWYAGLEELYKNIVPDYVDICLPNTLHKDAAIFAMEHGSHVLIEKPFALSLADIDCMIDTSKHTGKKIMVAHVCRFMPQYRFAHEAVFQKKYGLPLALTLYRDSGTPDWSWNNWLHDKKTSGGTIMDLSIHDIDIANWLLGIPTLLQAYEISAIDRVGVSKVISILGYMDTIYATITANHLMPKGYPLTAGYKLLFENAEIEWQTANTKTDNVTIFTHNEKKDIMLQDYYPQMDSNPYYEEIRTFVSCLLDNQPFPVSVADARIAVESVLKLTASSKVNPALQHSTIKDKLMVK